MDEQEPLNEQELNKKLAEWRFPPPEYRVYKVYPDFIAIDKQFTAEVENHVLSIDPTLKGALKVGEWYRHENIKILTQSLDTSFRLLVPKAIDKIMADQQCSSDIAYAILFKKWLQELELIIPKAALALCLAISKLIDELAIKKT